MPTADIQLTTRKPTPPNADFAFSIDFKRGEGSASRVFAATHDFIKACEKLDKELVQAIDSNIETVMMLEDIEVGSIKTWLKNCLVASDDQALKDLDWRPAVGKYLVRAKYAVLKWIDDDTAPKDLPALGRELRRIASETDVKYLPDYRAPTPDALLNALKDFQGVKDHLLEHDRAEYITSEGTLELNLSMRWDIESLEALAVRETIQFPAAVMVLVVKKPDYLGESKWELRHGKKNIHAKIQDEVWLKKFQSRKIDVRPGDALRCNVEVAHLYGHDNELIAERYAVIEVLDILVNQYNQGDLFKDFNGE